MIFYVIRHKASNKLMPQMKRGRGYTHWNPNKITHILGIEEDTPRLISSMKKAKRIANYWAILPNLSNRPVFGYDGHEDYSLLTHNDGRKREDIEIIKVEMRIR